MGFKKKKNKKSKAPALVSFASATNEEGNKQICVYVKCEFSGHVVGPIWSHTDQAVKRALATLTQECDCPAKFHKAVEYQGHRVMTPSRRRRRPD